MHKSDKIYIAGHTGMVGSALLRLFKKKGFNNFLLRTHYELDLTDALATRNFLKKETPDVVIIAAARVGGIHANSTYVAEFIHENLAIGDNLIHGAYLAKVPRVLFLGSSCIYPREAPQPMKEECLLTGPLESTNEAYAIAKIAGMKLCQFYNQQYGVHFHSAMPCNLYGPKDNYHAKNSHVIPGLIRRFHEAKINKIPEVSLWGTGIPRREFLHVDDLAAGVFTLLEQPTPIAPWVNIGYSSDISIRELGEIIQKVVGFTGKITFDTSKPDGMPRKLLDASKIYSLGWRPQYDLKSGIANAYKHFIQEHTLVSS